MIDTNTAYDHNLPFLKQIARKVHRRVRTAFPGSSIDFEDVLGELMIPYVRAARAFDATMGVPFKPYLARGCYQHVNRWIEIEIAPTGHAVSLDAGSETNFHEQVSSDDPTVLDTMIEREAMERLLKRLSPRCRQFVQLLTEPPRELLEAYFGLCARISHAKTQGFKGIMPQQLTAPIVFDFMGSDTFERTQIYAELRSFSKVGH